MGKCWWYKVYSETDKVCLNNQEPMVRKDCGGDRDKCLHKPEDEYEQDKQKERDEEVHREQSREKDYLAHQENWRR